MIESAYPEFEVFKVDDVFNIDKWSIALDRQIDLLAGPGQTATLYGSRDCMKYTGKYVLEKISYDTPISSTEIRKQLGIRWQNDEKWREGVIWSSQNRFTVCYPTVDMACVNLKENTVWMGRKPHEDLFRFPGGFADVHSDSYESDALRELNEEFWVDGTSLEYIGSTIADDPRYRFQEDKIKTLFYAVTAWEGTPTPGDDLKGGEVKLFDLDELYEKRETLVVPTHRVLVNMLVNWREKITARVKQTKK
jgi:bifunctional NMN adenylyltransferase/nudix hydrolase